MSASSVFAEIQDFYKIIPMKPLRRTPGVIFDNVPMELLPRINAIDRVIHAQSAVSPGPVGDVARPWYMHPSQDDNLIVLQGTRHVDIYLQTHGLFSFTVTPSQILQDGKILFDGPAMLVWPRFVFHRITSGPEGSASLNFAVHYEGLDLRTNFNIYDVDLQTGQYRVIREGFQDQNP
ncbi:hypothetical protein [Desulfonatronum sp. SC1]|uniref:hypothetical protein n=1 Tax=Desulfonatronum sp. SC1 TaxID=2109626 RepID=UPI000D30D296|nr:hypothetical protein [Desulfonatronum sp. SC1]PTN31302.1 hypothetical protein C6366_18270 [Desulfonatronum sp. SC1]